MQEAQNERRTQNSRMSGARVIKRNKNPKAQIVLKSFYCARAFAIAASTFAQILFPLIAASWFFICNRIKSDPLQTQHQLRVTLCSQTSHPLHFLQRRAGTLCVHLLLRRFAARARGGSMQQNLFLQTVSVLPGSLRAMAVKLCFNGENSWRRAASSSGLQASRLIEGSRV